MSTPENSPLTEAQVRSIIKEALSEFNSGLDRRFEVFSEDVAETIESSSANFLDELIEEAESIDLDDLDDDYDDEYDDDYEDEPVNRPDPEVLRLRRRLEEIEAQAEQDRQAREQAERDRTVAQMRSTALESIRKTGRVVNPDAMLKLLEADGHLTEKDGQYAIKTRDQYGELTKPIDEHLDTLLGGDYSYMASARPGTGTGATPGSNVARSSGDFKYLRDGKPDAKTVQEIMKDPEKRKEYLAEVNAAYGQ